MSQKTVILTVILFALIVIGMFAYAKIRHTELSDTALFQIVNFGIS